jgi:hypothetical protein
MAEVRMDYGTVNNVANGFQQTAEVLHGVSVVLEAAIVALKTAAFFTLGGTAFAERYLSNVKPRVDRLAATCEEMGGDLKATIADHQKADAEGGTAFN